MSIVTSRTEMAADDPAQAIETRNVKRPFPARWFRATSLSTATIALMAVTAIALFWFPVKRISANVEINYNEGWNAYRAAMAAHRTPLYGALPLRFGVGTAYPPISFHLIGWLGTPNTFVTVGRWISLLSLIVAGIFVALIVKRESGSWRAAIFAGLLYEISIALIRPDRLGMDDPQLLGEVLAIAGLYFYVRNPNSNRTLGFSALLFCLAGFSKHNLLAFPAAVALDLLLRSRRAFATWAGALLLFAGLLTATTFLVDGRYFLLHLMGRGARTYSYWMAWSGSHHYIVAFQSLLVMAASWSICMFRSRRVIVFAFVFSHALAFFLIGGFGVDLNIFFNALASAAIACGLAISDMSAEAREWRTARWNSAGALIAALFCISIMVYVPGQLRRDREKNRELRAREGEFDSAVEFLKGHPGPALCESLLLCYEAGKPCEYEAFSVRALLRSGTLAESDVLQLLKTRYFQTIQIALRSDEEKLNGLAFWASLQSAQEEPDTERRFSPNFMKELLEDYQLSKRTSEMAIFSPR